MYDSLVQHSVRRWLLGSRPAPPGRQIRKIPPRRFPITPRLEALEDRLTPATFNVTPTGAGLSSLAGAVAQANQDTSPDTIVLAPGQYNLTGQLAVTTPNALILQGTASSPGATVIDAGQADERILYV